MPDGGGAFFGCSAERDDIRDCSCDSIRGCIFGAIGGIDAVVADAVGTVSSAESLRCGFSFFILHSSSFSILTIFDFFFMSLLLLLSFAFPPFGELCLLSLDDDLLKKPKPPPEALLRTALSLAIGGPEGALMA